MIYTLLAKSRRGDFTGGDDVAESDDIYRGRERRRGRLPGVLDRIDGVTSWLGRVLTTSPADGKFVLVDPVSVSGDECEGCPGVLEPLGTAGVPVFPIAGAPAHGEDVLVNYVPHRFETKRAAVVPTGPPPCSSGHVCGRVIDGCSRDVPGVTVRVLQGGTTLGSGVTDSAGSFCIPIPTAGTYTVECDDPCVTTPTRSIAAVCGSENIVFFRRPTTPPTSLTDPLGNTIALSPVVGRAGYSSGCFAYPVSGTGPLYPSTFYPFNGCGYRSSATDRDCNDLPDGGTVPILYVASHCTLEVYALTSGNLSGVPQWLVAGACSDFPGDPNHPGCPYVGSLMFMVGTIPPGTDCPYVAQATVTFKPVQTDIDRACQGLGMRNTLAMLTLMFGDSGTFTMT